MKPAEEYADSAGRYMREAGSGDVERCKVAAMLAQANATLALAAATSEQTARIEKVLHSVVARL